MTKPDKKDPTLLKMRTNDDEIQNVKYKTEKKDHENIFKSLKIDKELDKKNYRSLNKKKILLSGTELLNDPGSTIGTSTMSLINPSNVIVITRSTTLLTSIGTLITNENILKLKTNYTKLTDWINVFFTLYEEI